MVRKQDHKFWKYVDQLPGGRWKCKYCDKVVKGGRPNRIVTHLAKKTGKGIVPCSGNVPDDVHAEALKEFNGEAPDMRQQQMEETAQQNDQRIGSENNPNIHPSFDNNLLQGFQPADPYVSGEASHLVVPDMQQQQIEETAQQNDQGIGSENNPNVHPSSDNNLLQGFQPADPYVSREASHLAVPGGSVLGPPMLHAQSQQPDLLHDSSFLQWNEVNTTIITAQDPPWQNMNGLGANMPSVSVRTEFDQSLLTLKRKLEDLSNRKEEKEEELHQLSKKERTIKRGYKRMKEAQSKGNHPTLEQLNEVKELISQAEGLGNLHVYEKETSRSAPCPKATPLSTSELIGRDFEVSEIRDSLASDDILRIGVYGMGGVGKTEIMMNIYNELLSDKEFDNVFWVTMPKTFCVYELQRAIGNAVHLEELSNEKDEKMRAAMLYRFFKSGKKYVVILDGLWRHFKYNDAGIPLKCNGLKLVITCQSLRVSRGMSCQKEIKISPISEDWLIEGDRPIEKDWKLFMHELGAETQLPREVAEIAKGIAHSCGGLPLYIKAAATRMRGVTDVQEWSDMMEKMKDPKERFHTLKGQVFDQLKLSYELLHDHELQQCLIFCAFYCGIKACPNLKEMEKFLVDVVVIDQRNSQEKLLHRTRSNLKELQKASLLSILDDDGEEVIDMHGEEVIEMHVSIIDLVLHIAADTNILMVDCVGPLHEGFQIEGANELWLMRDPRDEISKLSSNEIRLPILMSKEGCSLRMIPDSLSTVFSDIKFLDISKSKIEELPNFISDLVKLTALVLRDCSKLRHIPNIGKLTSLRHLDLSSCCELKDSPDGLEDLVNLEELNLYLTGIVKIPKGVLRNLRKLQYLYINFVRAKELKGLVMLKKLYCSFSTLKELAKFDNSFYEKGHANTEYAITVTSSEDLEEINESTEGYFEDGKRTVVLFYCEDEEREVIVPPKNIQELRISENGSQRIMWPDWFGQENLEKLDIWNCPNLKYVMEPEANTRYSFSKLEEIRIESCNGLEEIIAASSLLHPSPFSCLKFLLVYSCNKMKRLLNHDMLRHLSKLQSIDVTGCEKMDELISTSNGCTSDFCATTPLPKLQLRTLTLARLPELRSIGAIALACPIKTIAVYKCPKLKKIPLQMEQSVNGDLFPPSSLREIKIAEDEIEWWNSLEWESPEAKDALEPYLRHYPGLQIELARFIR